MVKQMIRDVRRRSLYVIGTFFMTTVLPGLLAGEMIKAWEASWVGALSFTVQAAIGGLLLGASIEWLFDESVHFGSLSKRQLDILVNLHNNDRVKEVFDREVVQLYEMGLVEDAEIGVVNQDTCAYELILTPKGRGTIKAQPLSWMLAERRVS